MIPPLLVMHQNGHTFQPVPVTVATGGEVHMVGRRLVILRCLLFLTVGFLGR